MILVYITMRIYCRLLIDAIRRCRRRRRRRRHCLPPSLLPSVFLFTMPPCLPPYDAYAPDLMPPFDAVLPAAASYAGSAPRQQTGQR